MGTQKSLSKCHSSLAPFGWFWRRRGLRGGVWHDDFNKTQKFNALQTTYSRYTPLAG
jgi:hypothetical protein